MHTPPLAVVPYWRLSFFYFFYFGLLGAWLPFWPLYLQALEFSAKQMGVLAGIMMATKIIAPNIWGWIADYSGKRLAVIRLGGLLSFVIFASVFLTTDFLHLCLIVAGFSFFWNAILAQFEVLTLDYLHSQSERYGLIRVWGSVGFILAVVALGWVFDSFSINFLPVFLFLILLGIWLSSLCVSEPAETNSHHQAKPTSIKSILIQPSIIAFFSCCFLLQLSHGAYYTFFSLYLKNHDYSNVSIGLLWSLGVLAEVVVFTFMHHLLIRFSLRHIMLASLLLSAIRWLLIAYYPDNIALLLFAQCLHAASFGTFHAFAVEVIRRCFSGGHQGQGMALYSGVSYGAGGAGGAVISGWIWDIDPVMTFVAAALMCIVAFFIGLRVRL